MRRARRLVFALLLASWLPTPSHGADLVGVLTDYNVESWTDKDGLPRGPIRALAQDANGYLWIGSETGLIRFDGLRFQSWDALGRQPLPKQPVQALTVARDGSLWVGFNDTTAVVRIRGTDVRSFGEADGIPPGEVMSLSEDGDGVIWAGHSTGLYRFAADQWVREPSVPAGRVRRVVFGPSGRVFAALDQRVVMRAQGREHFETIDTPERFVSAVHEDRRGHVWMSDTFIGVMPAHAAAVSPVGIHAPSSRDMLTGIGQTLLSDASGGLWIGTAGQGLWYARRATPDTSLSVEVVTTHTGLSSDIVTVLLEDRDGNVWAGTADGLNRLRRHPFTTLTSLGVVSGLDAGPDGAVWAVTPTGLARFTGGRTDRFDRAPVVSQVRAMHAARDSSLWLATDEGLWRSPAAGTGPAAPAKVSARLRRVRGITSDSRYVWFYDLDAGVGRWDGRTLDVIELPEEYRHGLICSIQASGDGHLWIGFRRDVLLALSPGPTFTAYRKEHGVDAGLCNELFLDGDGALWVLGLHGLARQADGRFATLRGPQDLPLENLHGMVEDASGATWLNAQGGIARLVRSDVASAFEGQWERVRATTYGASSGIAGRSARVGQSAVRAANGALWFLTSLGVTVVGPQDVHAPMTNPAVSIDTVVVDDQRSLGLPASLPPRVRRVEIEYSAPMLSAGPRPRLRYRLDGFDTGWREAGRSQRVLAYTNLPPRAYTLIVEKVSGDSALATTAWTFSVRPAFYQTSWFVVTCLLALAGTASLTWRRRLHKVRGEFALLLKERVRLSREIHDTLLQSLIGVSLQLEQVEHDVETSPTGKERLLRARHQVEEYIREARESIWNLRSSMLEREGLAAALRHAGERATTDSVDGHERPEWRFTLVGTEEPCGSEVEEHLLKIGQEAVMNATRHSGARRIAMELRYEDTSVRLRITDDGQGFDPSRIEGAGGHWGIVNMQERASTIGGTLSLTSGKGQGTTVQVDVPRTPLTRA